jgi:glutamyl-tRNA synthetase
MIRTRFAPSPTGKLHLGGARTALFNWLYTKHQGGIFCVRVEDTDQARSSEESLASILDGLKWLGLDSDEPLVFQSQNAARHVVVANRLIEAGAAYWCDLSGEALTALKEAARAEGRAPLYPSRTQSRPYQPGKSVLRFKMPQEGGTVFDDQVQGRVEVPNSQLDDLVLLRSDGSPTYMLSVVVDDHDMQITDVIRGADHLSNTPKQIQIYQALNWTVPRFAHIPLIHGADGAKLSKRHGALDVGAYREDGFLKDALLNALLRLGWGHGDQEIFSIKDAASLFSLQAVGRSAARFDPAKLSALNAHYMRMRDPEMLLEDVRPFLGNISPSFEKRLRQGLPSLALRAQTLKELALGARIYSDAASVLSAEGVQAAGQDDLLRAYLDHLKAHERWTAGALEAMTRTFVDAQGVKLGPLAGVLRLALTGSKVSPPLFEVMTILGSELTIKRLESALDV